MMKNFYCAWCLISNSTLLNIEWPDSNSQYYGTIINTTTFNLNGYFPNTRYFSFELYSLDTWEPFWDIHDTEIDVDTNPYLYNINYTTNLSYNIDVKLNDKYNETYILLYRMYLGSDLTGGVRLPDISIYKNDNWENVTQCDTSNRPTINIQDTQPNYLLYHSNENNNFYPPESTKNLFINDDAHYMVAFYNNTNETFKWSKIIFKLPSYAESMYSIVNKDYEVRYFSVSTIDLSQPRQTVETIHDVILQEHSMNGYVELIVSCNEDGKFLLHLDPPSKNDNHSCITKTSYFGVLYRQLMPRFKNEIPKHMMSNETLEKIMNKYYPEIYWF